MNTEIAFPKVFLSFLSEVRAATSMLMYALAGIEVYRRKFSSGSAAITPPVVPGICLSPVFSGIDYHDLLDPAGLAAQLAFKGWIEHTYRLWEDGYRNDSQVALKGLVDDAIRPEADVFGDFRHIRNDLVHGGVATESRSGKCAVLKWFSPGEPIVFKFNHVLDFLNQIGAFDSKASFSETKAQVHMWILSADEETLNAWNPAPTLVSVRASEGHTPGTLGVSVAFDNGVFGQIPLTFPEATMNQGVEISTDGKSLVIDEGTFRVTARHLYADCLVAWFHPERGPKGPVMWSPSFRFRRGTP